MPTISYRTNCYICGKKITYNKQSKQLTCFICDKTYSSNTKCEDNHFVCDNCHSLSANELIEKICITSKLQDPIKLAMTLMANAKIMMHGPEHHFLVPAVLLASYYNIKNNQTEKEVKIKEAKSRSTKILGGFCGFYGICGAAVGTGIFISLITNSTPLSVSEWRASNLITAKSLTTIALHGGPRCCKRNTFLAIIETTQFMKEHFNFEMNIDKKIQCQFNNLNEECLKDNCNFYSENK